MVDVVTIKQGDLVKLSDGQHGIVADVGKGLVSVMRMDWPSPKPPKVYLIETVTRLPMKYHGRQDPTPTSHGDALI